ncbi:phage head completion protein [Streptomyces antarcticus]|uniref:phage head completion protein n=1 Tax=Streptomyces antarcticus TaxID=2996458 RepID=UPI00226EA05D|nr:MULTISPECIES: head-tail adaptor protein [unclassified Streptomyces]MCY0941907.1 head-tail adaptor protein [Streptomyces sp. H34-AA3]MCZ4082820.1 head-tail adaptor protein [Streptomyces sp. H34-S5]
MFSDPVEVWRTATQTKNAYTSRPDWDQAVKVWEGLADVQPDKAYESYSPARDQSQERLTAFVPYIAAVASGDRVKYKGHMYEVDGEPEQWGATSRRHLKLSIWRALK